jgi:Xaa-Pro dipeptidase
MFSRRRFLWTAAASAPALALHAQDKAPEKFATEEPALPPAILALTDRRKDIVSITLDERNSRLDLARELMKQYSIDALLITTGASLKYYTGINWWQSERMFAYVIPQAAAPFVICPYLERDHFGDIFLGFPEHETTLTYFWKDGEDPFVILRRVLTETEITTGTLGIEEKVPYGMANMIAQASPALKIVPATPVTAGARSLKSPAEIACLRLANQITIDVYKAVYLSCGPGDTSHKFSSLVDKAYARCGVQGEVSCNVGMFSASPHGSPKPQTIREGDIVMIDDGCTVEGYTSDITRSFVYGTPTDLQRQVFDVVRNAQSSALATAFPGVEMLAVDEAARKVITDAGYGDNFLHRVGHGIGLDMHEWPYLVPGNRQKLMASMVFSDEPGIYLPGKFGIRLEDDMLITDKGAELFTPQSPSLQEPFAIPPKAVPAPDTAAPADATKPASTKAPEAPSMPTKQ